jgi:hypothetical protein
VLAGVAGFVKHHDEGASAVRNHALVTATLAH